MQNSTFLPLGLLQNCVQDQLVLVLFFFLLLLFPINTCVAPLIELLFSCLLISCRVISSTMKGAGDTYFSGKMLAKLARIILIADQIDDQTEGVAEFVSMR